jgi:biopolymer transport protein ExbD
MKFPRNARIFRGQLDAAPFASVFFLLLIFVLLFTLPGSLLHTPGIPVRIQPPIADALPGTDQPTISVAMDKAGNIYFENQIVSERYLSNQLSAAAQKISQPLTLIALRDKEATDESLVRLIELARKAGIANVTLAILPRPFESANPASPRQ